MVVASITIRRLVPGPENISQLLKALHLGDSSLRYLDFAISALKRFRENLTSTRDIVLITNDMVAII
jgi:hypothetical protein